MTLQKNTKHTKYTSSGVKKANKKSNKSTTKNKLGFDSKRNYSSFWMDGDWDSTTKFSGLSQSSQSSDLVKLVKLNNYRRAITNFVKIVTKKDIPVTWAGSQSFTDGKSVTLSTDIKDSNFDVTVGLALHEASHIVLSDFRILQTIKNFDNLQLALLTDKIHELCKPFGHSIMSVSEIMTFFKSMLNWIEDRRIDNYIFTTSPGYKAYYHKLYDAYWNSSEITKGLLNKTYRDPSDVNNYVFHTYNMINPSFDSKALPGLDEIVKLIDLSTIARLNSTDDASVVARQVCEVIVTHVVAAMQSKNDNQSQNNAPNDLGVVMQNENDLSGSSQSDSDDGNGSSQSDSDDKNDSLQSGSSGDGKDDENGSLQSSSGGVGADDDSKDGSASVGDDSDASEDVGLSDAEKKAIEKAIEKQKSFLDGDVGKKGTTKKLSQRLESAAKQSIDLQVVGDGLKAQRTVLLYDYTKSNELRNLHEYCMKRITLMDERSNRTYNSTEHKVLSAEIDNLYNSIVQSGVADDFKLYQKGDDRSKLYEKAIIDGIEMGGLLGKKLQLHNENRERVDTRLRNGKIDPKRLAHAGYGIEGIFKQIHVDKYKKANLHISLDGSGSMSGPKWANTVKVTMALAKAASYTQNINIQVSVRCTVNDGGGESPTTSLIYDSRKNKIVQLVTAFQLMRPRSMTPEGLCFEAMIKKNWFVESNNDLDSYFLNISDGEPSCNAYCGDVAANHTKRQIDYMKSVLNMSVLSFFIDSVSKEAEQNYELFYTNLVNRFTSSNSGRLFRIMYGKDATVVDCTSAIHIAKELNKKFLTKVC